MPMRSRCTFAQPVAARDPLTDWPMEKVRMRRRWGRSARSQRMIRWRDRDHCQEIKVLA
jgi:hypothetical protein